MLWREAHERPDGAPRTIHREPFERLPEREQYHDGGRLEPLPDRCRTNDRNRHQGIDVEMPVHAQVDRKSTRLNSSHVAISYAVFCLKKKKQQHKEMDK